MDQTLIEPEFTFTFIGFEWLQPLPGDGMYYYYALMAVAGLMIMFGLWYRMSATLFFLLWTGTYLMQKTSYNNHYYLLVLLSGAMAVMPAHKYYSLDVRFGFTRKSLTCARGCITFFIVQILIVYVFASINKIYPDWLSAEPISIWFGSKKDYWLIGNLLQEKWLQYGVAYGGIVYDGIIVFLLLFKRTRWVGFWLSVFFNLFNSAVFQIGIFPYLMIALSVLFFPEVSVRKFFFKRKPAVEVSPTKLGQPVLLLFLVYFAIQIWLPLRHYWYPGDVRWTEEGHRMAWQMMLYSKSAYAKFTVVNTETGETDIIRTRDHLTRKQRLKMAGRPDMIWQFVQHIKEQYKGQPVAIYVEGKCKLNRGEFRELVDPEVDMAAVEWKRFDHAEWIKIYEEDDRSEK